MRPQPLHQHGKARRGQLRLGLQRRESLHESVFTCVSVCGGVYSNSNQPLGGERVKRGIRGGQEGRVGRIDHDTQVTGVACDASAHHAFAHRPARPRPSPQPKLRRPQAPLTPHVPTCPNFIMSCSGSSSAPAPPPPPPPPAPPPCPGLRSTRTARPTNKMVSARSPLTYRGRQRGFTWEARC
mgnify:CR=1 FL=1